MIDLDWQTGNCIWFLIRAVRGAAWFSSSDDVSLPFSLDFQSLCFLRYSEILKRTDRKFVDLFFLLSDWGLNLWIDIWELKEFLISLIDGLLILLRSAPRWISVEFLSPNRSNTLPKPKGIWFFWVRSEIYLVDSSICCGFEFSSLVLLECNQSPLKHQTSLSWNPHP